MSYKVLPITSVTRPLSLDGLKLSKNNLLVLWCKAKARLCNLSHQLGREKHCFGVLNLPCGIKDIILVEKSIICLAQSGLIYVTDLSEDVFGKQEDILEYKEFKFTKDVLCISSTTNGFAALRKSGELMVFKLTYMESGISNICHQIVKSIPCNISFELSSKCVCMTVLRSNDFHLNLASLLFRETALLDCDILFIGVESGNVYWIPILSSSDDDDFNLLHCSNSPVKGIVCAADKGTKKYDKIMILSSNGSVAVIRCGILEMQLKCNVFYFPSSIKSFCLVLQNNIFHSDGLNLWYSNLVDPETENFSFVTQLLPIKGVVALATGNGDFAVAGSRHAILYEIDSSCKGKDELRVSDKCVKWSETVEKDSKSILSELQHVAHELSTLGEKFATENKALREISIAARGDLFKDMLKLKVEVDDNFPQANKETLIVKVTNKSPQEFSKDFWSFHVLVSSGPLNINSIEKLDSPFKPNSTFVFVIPVESREFTLPIIVDCSIMLVIPVGNLNESGGEKSQHLEIPLQRQFLGITHFLSPVLDESLTNIQESKTNREECWKKMLMRFRSASKEHIPKNLRTHHLLCYSFKLPEITSWAAFIEETIKNSQHRFLNNLKDAQMVKFRIRYSTLIFTYYNDKHSVDVVSSNQEILSYVKNFIIHTFLLGKELVGDNVVRICLDENDLVKAQNLKFVFELEQVKGISMENMNCLKKEIREFVNTCLPI